VGNRQNDEGYFLSKKANDVRDTDAHHLLLHFFTGTFNTAELYRFTHPTDVANNDIFQLAQRVFEGKYDFVKLSSDVAKLLYDKSDHPKIKGGELYVVTFSGIDIENEKVTGLGIFKSENKTPFMKVLHKTDVYDYEFEQGIDLHAIDKACIILNVRPDDGYRVYIHDRQSKGEEALYWKNLFLGLKPCADGFQKTKQFMSLAKEYIKDVLPQEFEVEKTDQIEMLNKSVAFFKGNEQFDYGSFTREVISEPHIMKSFDRFKEEYEERNEIPLGDGFAINDSAVKSQSRFFKSVLKLDRNFHVYVHGNKDLMERGYDEERGMNYYKLFYRDES
jgi:hypothetical protein